MMPGVTITIEGRRRQQIVVTPYVPVWLSLSACAVTDYAVLGEDLASDLQSLIRG